jgi:hypothetical protein
VSLALEDLGHLVDPLDEGEAAQLPEGVVERMENGQEEDARTRAGVGASAGT